MQIIKGLSWGVHNFHDIFGTAALLHALYEAKTARSRTLESGKFGGWQVVYFIQCFVPHDQSPCHSLFYVILLYFVEWIHSL